MPLLPPINFATWIEENRHLLRPPVGNRVVYTDTDFIIMVVGGPNSRTDFHVNEGEEFFYQLEGDVNIRVHLDGKIQDIPLRQGEIFMLPPRVPHSPQRGANTVGLVIERKRKPEEKDGFVWFDDQGAVIYEEYLHVTDIVQQLPEVFKRKEAAMAARQ